MTLPVVVVTAGGAGNDPPKTAERTQNQKKENELPQSKKGHELQKDESIDPKLDLSMKKPNNKMILPRTSSKKLKGKLKGRAENLKSLDSLYKIPESMVALPSSSSSSTSRNLWLSICFFGIMFSFVLYGLLLEYATSGGRKLHELSFLFITSGLYTIAGAAGRHIRDETPTQIPPARFAILGLTSMGSTYCSVRSLRYVIYPIQVLAKACKPVPVMLMGTILGKYYPPSKYINVVMIVLGVALFMGGGGGGKKDMENDEMNASSQIMGIVLLFISLCFDGATGAYEDKLMAVHQVGPFDLMYNIQLGKTILAGVGLVVLNQVHEFLRMCQDMGFLLIALGLSGALGQAFIFVTIAKFGALTCSIIGLARKVTTLVASIVIYGHMLTSMQVAGLITAVAAMILNFLGKTKRKKTTTINTIKEEEAEEEVQNLLFTDNDESERNHQDDEEVSEPILENPVNLKKVLVDT
mmetsp:Transcript_4388/g.5067  ORF Transcript_4388/g.5067 Transcript_4388/m.5067 type:complete len:468 (-) Transcript_4388:161-1564(-)|eukprot:CAMPEP_0194158798 /NCGR_PEP_ID=MMETSP0152-20130528/77478_1 /TAXON_ID=1049557 /ORGANISM="Thalassiothrix antarctica, Strain L6-D1" /LENGTH=467 /DNA_ID=CAMNT_0038868299 /DNA_START=165 /DNA_END=1568 /DNA_ORIENTATION=+